MKVCKLVITHIGENMPCTEPPGPTVTGYENTEIVYAGGVIGDEHQCDKEAEYKFTVQLRNHNLTADKVSIQEA